MTENVRNGHVDIYISNHPAGVYLLRITINNHSTTWKIIKK
ncbi:MAG: T9SS type A sorting domain-containing protein [Prevotella sp.]|nr:T9SS type A sorting domain-containing protein [Prevotella sp.]